MNAKQAALVFVIVTCVLALYSLFLKRTPATPEASVPAVKAMP